MPVVVDTSVWSLALRPHRKNLSSDEKAIVFLLRELIINGDAVLLGLVRQELLTGISSAHTFSVIRDQLHDFDDLPPVVDDYERAADSANKCVAHGVAVSIADMLICSVAEGRGLAILTTDADFGRYAQILPIKLHKLP